MKVFKVHKFDIIIAVLVALPGGWDADFLVFS